MMNTPLKDYRIMPAGGETPARVIIFLHGLGDNGNGGLLEIGRIWQAHVKDCAFLCPDAPHPFDMGPPDFAGRQWFSLQSHGTQEMLAGAKAAAPILNAYIDHVMAEFNLTADKIILAGFSQGTMMALYTGLRRTEPVAGILGYSGMLLGADTLTTEKRSSPPVMLVHGTQDAVVPYAAMIAAEQGLKVANIKVETITCRCEHTIDEEGLREGLRFIRSSWAL